MANTHKTVRGLRGRDFDQLQRRLQQHMQTVLGQNNRQAMAALQTVLSDLNWSHPTAPACLLGAIYEQLDVLKLAIPDAVEPLLDQVVHDVYRAARIAQVAKLTNRHRLRSTGRLAMFGLPDTKTLKQLQQVRQVVIRQGWQQKLNHFSDNARGLLMEAAKQGLSKRAVGKRLMQQFAHQLGESPGRAGTQCYWDMTGSAWLNTARNRAHLQTFDDAGITHYRILAVLDERTTPICASLNGTLFSVQTQLQHEQQAATCNSLDELKAHHPWLSARHAPQARGAASQQVGIRRGGAFVAVAQAATGNSGGKLLHSPAKLQALGVGMPPYHGHCRTTVVAVS